ncbi:NADPH-dependent F420 reductase [Acerihabitans arboris]|uniref:NADP oxidoreductase n=1 Tax=Acerihabitans arboris TaxID=2691583 RepID=A0A845SRH6_9GAMM|nr:NADPH-dependent F420 reductase [Acerihabitans arboris]NDL65476.1 NADP oxidoreductase [Acerihabitans arboris]
MKVGFIGAGMIARAVATLMLKQGHEVMFSNSRSPDTLFTLRRTLGCEAGTPEEAAEFGDIVLVATPLKNYRSIPAAPLAGKIVLDAQNYYPERDGNIAELDNHETTTSELLARHLPNSIIVKAFNAIAAPDVEKDGRPAGSINRRALPIAGNDPEAKRVVANLIEQMGFDVVDAGPLAAGKRFEEGTAVYCVPLNSEQLKTSLAAVK